MVSIAASIMLTIAIGLLGPSAMIPALGGPGWHPPYSLDVHPHPYAVVAMAAAAIVLGGLGLLAALTALPPAATSARLPRVLVIVGSLAAGLLAFLPPAGSGDHLNYAAYGRMVTLGLDPYTHGAHALPGDPIADAVEAPWREEPSVYGPVATAVQALAGWIGGDSLRLTIFVLALVNAAAFIATGLLIDRFTRDDPARRTRAALLWTVNPLLLYQLVAGMHVDTLVVACMVAALLARGRPVVGGALLGVGVALKLNAGLVALGPAWELRRRPARLALMAGIALAVVAVGYAIVGPAALEPVTRTSKSVSNASFWKLVQGWLQSLVGTGSAYRGEIQIGSLLVLALVAWCLFRLTSHRLPLTTRLFTPGPPRSAAAEPLPGDLERSPGDPERLPGDLERPPSDLERSPGDPERPPGDPGRLPGGGEHPPSGGRQAPTAATGGSSAADAGRVRLVSAAKLPDPSTAGRPDPAGRPAGESSVHGQVGPEGGGKHVGGGGGGDEATVVALVLVVAYLFASPYVLPWYDGLAFGLLALVAASTVDRFMVVHLIVLSLAYLPARVAGQPPELEWLRTVVRGEFAPWALLALTAALVVWTWRAAGRVRTRPESGAPRP